METLFQSLRYLRGMGKYDFSDVTTAPASLVDNLINVLRNANQYDPHEKVGPLQLPLLHALSRESEIPVEWLDLFAKSAQENLLFDTVEGATLGSICFDSLMKKQDLPSSPTMLWWIANAPTIEPAQATQWIDRLSRINSSSSTTRSYQSNSIPVENAQKFLKALFEKAGASIKQEPGRPQERWSRKQVWWEQLKKDDRLNEMVLAPSGRIRPMIDLLRMPGMHKNTGFSQWESGNKSISIEAPHGRSKELLEDWVLDPTVPMSVRTQRLASSIEKTKRVLDEIKNRSAPRASRAADVRPALKELLLHRTPSGMTLRTWFFLSQEKDSDWPDIHESLMGNGFNETDQWWLGPNGEGIILQKMSAATGDGVGEFSRFEYLQSTYLGARTFHHDEIILAGDPSTHQELVDLLTDALVAPSSNNVATTLAEFVLARNLVSEDPLCTKLRQAFDLRQLKQFNRSADVNARYGTLSNKEKALNTAVLLHDEVERGEWHIHLSARDWGSLFNEWGLSPDQPSKLDNKAKAAVNRLVASLYSAGERFALAEATVETQQNAAISTRRPRL